MTKVIPALTGTHPMGESLVQSILDYKYGRANNKLIIEKFDHELKQLIELQEKSKYPTISVGNFGVEDLIRPFTRSLNSLKSYEQIGDLPIVRYHYTNTFFRKPQLVEKLPETGNVLTTDKNLLTEKSAYHHNYLSEKRSKIVLPGPYTFTSMIESLPDGPYESMEDFILASAEYIGNEIGSLPSAYREIQLDEPFLVWNRIPRTLRPIIAQAYEIISSKITNRDLLIHTYFESAENILSFLLELPVHGIGIDFYKTNILNIVDFDFSDKILQAGIIDSQNFVPDQSGNINQTNNGIYSDFVKTLSQLEPKKLVIGPTTGLEYLPRNIADQKVTQIQSIVSKYQEEA